jgi:hypothetical protein
MIAIDHLEFQPKLPDDPDDKCVARFDFAIYGIIFKSWKIRCKDGCHYSISPPFVKHLGEKYNIIHFQNKDDFVQIARTVIQAAKDSGIIRRNPQGRW